eukprot:363531-Chlamydomonas_euryale.AAC.10
MPRRAAARSPRCMCARPPHRARGHPGRRDSAAPPPPPRALPWLRPRAPQRAMRLRHESAG